MTTANSVFGDMMLVSFDLLHPFVLLHPHSCQKQRRALICLQKAMEHAQSTFLAVLGTLLP
jgi:hypothetical protein